MMENIIRPFVGRDVTPQAFHPPGQQGTPDVRVRIGGKGGIKTLSGSVNYSEQKYIGEVHREKPSPSGAIQAAMSS